MLGKETITVNDEVVSSKFSIIGSEHLFKLTENGEVFEGKIAIKFGLNGLVFNFYADGKPIIEAPKGGCLGFLLGLIIFIIVISILKFIF